MTESDLVEFAGMDPSVNLRDALVHEVFRLQILLSQFPKPEMIRWSLRYDGAVGLDDTNGCFVCGETRHNGYCRNISGFVPTLLAGTWLEHWFGNKGARLDYRDAYPHRIQLKVGSCDLHLPALESMAREIVGGGGFITPKTIADARAHGKGMVPECQSAT
jgi:hypothetical protein